MRSFSVIALIGVVAAFATLKPRQISPGVCTGLTSNAQCCATDVIGVADLDCQSPPTGPIPNGTALVAICSSLGQRGRCCALPILGQDLICISPV